jgi:hypothetical protein
VLAPFHIGAAADGHDLQHMVVLRLYGSWYIFCDRTTFSARYTTLRSSMLILLYLPALLGWLAVPLG